MQEGLKIDATFFGKFGLKVRSLMKPEMPVKLNHSSLTLGIPVLGSVTVYWTT